MKRDLGQSELVKNLLSVSRTAHILSGYEHGPFDHLIDCMGIGNPFPDSDVPSWPRPNYLSNHLYLKIKNSEKKRGFPGFFVFW